MTEGVRNVSQVAWRTPKAVFDDDLVGEALLRGVIAFRQTAYVTHPRAFFSKIVKDTVRDHWRRRRPWTSLESIGAIRQVFDFEGEFDRARKLERLRAAFAKLTTHECTLMELFYFEELSIAQICAISRKSRSALKMALLRGRRNTMGTADAVSTHSRCTPG